ncbi:MAG: hypothetical protein HY552_04635 [Elusimicrobia bacterium]|nr:hypothetical protein [Elusimicrobiota bacterium]
MAFIESSAGFSVRRAAIRAAAEGGGVALAALWAAERLFPGPDVARALCAGVGAAWAASAASVGWLLWARSRSARSFWRAFGGGMALRVGALAALAAWGWRREGVSLEALLLSYVFVLLATLLTLDFRYLRLR